MEVHQLRYVCAVADTGNFSRAAERCGVAQPSLSQQVLKLEDDLGVKLFDRLGRSIRLTEAGRAFIPRARAILEQLDAARTSAAVSGKSPPSLVRPFARRYRIGERHRVDQKDDERMHVARRANRQRDCR